MARINIDDLKKDENISKDEMKKVVGGLASTLSTKILFAKTQVIKPFGPGVFSLEEEAEEDIQP